MSEPKLKGKIGPSGWLRAAAEHHADNVIEQTKDIPDDTPDVLGAALAMVILTAEMTAMGARFLYLGAQIGLEKPELARLLLETSRADDTSNPFWEATDKMVAGLERGPDDA